MASRLRKTLETDTFAIGDHGISIPLQHLRRLAKADELGELSESGLTFVPRQLLKARESEE